ncbi:MAG: SDR family oxidoreductase [Acholeplasmataceae bacterium]
MKVVIITGASSGIGLATAKILSEKGAKVYSISRSKVFDKHIKSIQADVTDLESLERAYQDIFEIEGRIDCIINNAGMGISGSIEDTDPDQVAYLFNVNFMGVFNSTKAVLPLMRQQGYGRILNVSSVAARLSIPFQAFYSSSKAAINAFTEALANEVAPFGIKACAIMPGDIKTGFTKNRQKNNEESTIYKKRVAKSLAVMEKDEQNGMDSEYAARIIKRLVYQKHLPLYKTIGFKYKLFVFLHKCLPAKLANTLVGSVYAFKKLK